MRSNSYRPLNRILFWVFVVVGLLLGVCGGKPAEEPWVRISQVLTNLLSNAVKFTASGGVDVQMTAEHRAGEVLVRYVVRDTGIGIEESQVGNLFSAFTQADSSTTRSYGGTGLGLAISHRLAEIMGGDLWFSGGPGGPGAEFTFTVPLSVVTRQSTGGKPSATCAPPALTTLPARLKGARVLLAEDNDINRIIARELLEKVGFAVDEAVDGAEAVEKAKHTAYAAIFMDIQMPRMDGFAATSALRRIKKLKNLPIIALTAHAMVGDKEKSLAAGMNAHLTKPLDEEELCRTVVQLMPDAAAPEQAVPRRGKTRRQTPAPHEKVVDLELGLRRVGDKRELLFRLLERLSRECPGILSSLAEHLREGRWEQAALVAHTLKGSAANLGAEPLRAAASTLDNAIRLGDGASTLALQADLEREMARFSAAVAAAVSLKD